MSGIAGIYNLDGRPVDERVLRAMTDVVSHRGPDGIGHWVAGPVGLGHLQLCTTPESLREHQPLVSPDGNYVITCDGRVDNREELVGALRDVAPVSTESTDVELILHAYIAWGLGFVERLVGDFAFAIWDSVRQQLICVRDPIGTRLFHYYLDGRRLLFGTEIKQLFRCPGVPRELDEEMLGLFLCSSFGDGQQTFYRNVKRLGGGHMLVASRSGVAVSHYWAPDPADRLQRGSDEEYAEEFLRLFQVAVRSRLRGVSPVALKLSGGLDSGSVAVMVGQMRREDPTLCPDFQAYSYDFGDYEGVDAPASVQSVAESAGIPLNWIDVGGIWGLQATADEWAWDEPYRPPFEAIERLSLARLRDDGVRVLLTGEGSDDLLHVGPLLHVQDWVRSLRLRSLWREWRHATPGYKQFVLRVMVRSLIPKVIRARRSGWTDEVPAWVAPEFARRTLLRERLAALEPRPRWAGSYDEALRTEIRYGGRSPIALAGDQLCAEYDIEWRHPFWDSRLAEFLVRLPPQQKYRQGVSKFILRRSVQGLLPEVVRRRAKKSSFISLFERGLRDKEASRLATLLVNPRLGELQVVDAAILRAAFGRYQGGDDVERGRLYWALASEEWLREAFSQPAPKRSGSGAVISPAKGGGNVGVVNQC